MRAFTKPGRSGVWADNGMVATSHPIAAQVGLDILKAGGNAMDAAIAGAVVLGVCEPAMCGLAGDCFALVTTPDGDAVKGWNGSGTAPAGADPEALRAKGLTAIPPGDAQAVTLPGAVRAFDDMSANWGKLGLDRILAPAIRYFEEGVPVHERAARDWDEGQGNLAGAARRHFLPWGHSPNPGDRFALPGQAEVLRRVARDGAQAFYEGEVAEDMVAALKARGGAHTAEDFAAVAGMETTPLHGSYRGTDIWEHPPNGQGATAILLLNILGHFDLAKLDPLGAERAHIEAEATKHAYAARNAFIADPAHGGSEDRMLDPAFAAELAAQIDPARARAVPTVYEGSPHRDTIYITAVDRDRMAVSLIYSVFHDFGSRIATDTFGLMLHNRGCGFTLTPGHANELAPGKRPLHTIIPGVLGENGRPTLPFGVMGGQYQATGHARFATNLQDFGMSPQQAIDAPRSFFRDGVLELEDGYAPEVADQLAAMGHEVNRHDDPIGGAQAIRIHASGVLEGGSDPRKDGCAVGY